MTEASKPREESMVSVAEKMAPLARIKLSISTSLRTTSFTPPVSFCHAKT